MWTFPAANPELEGKAVCVGEGEQLLCNETGECQQRGAESLEAGQDSLWSFLTLRIEQLFSPF